jgi:hypothetical protein
MGYKLKPVRAHVSSVMWVVRVHVKRERPPHSEDELSSYTNLGS